MRRREREREREREFMVCLWFVYGFWEAMVSLWMLWEGVYDLFMVYLWFGGMVFMICSRFIYCLGEGVYDLFTIYLVWRKVF